MALGVAVWYPDYWQTRRVKKYWEFFDASSQSWAVRKARELRRIDSRGLLASLAG
jgi:hypothetical protein